MSKPPSKGSSPPASSHGSGSSMDDGAPESAAEHGKQTPAAAARAAKTEPMAGSSVGGEALGSKAPSRTEVGEPAEQALPEASPASTVIAPKRPAGNTLPPLARLRAALRQRKRLAIGGGIGLGAMVLAGLAAVAMRPVAALPEALTQQLPSNTTSVVSSRIRSDAWGRHTMSDLELASAWAERACGGLDIARALTVSARLDHRSAEALGLRVLTAPKRVRAWLECGMAVGQTAGASARVTQVAWGAKSKTHRATLVPLPGGAVPSWAPEHARTWSGLSGRVDQAKASAVERAGLVLGESWVSGGLPDVKDLAAHAAGSADASRAVSGKTTTQHVLALSRMIGPFSSAQILIEPSHVDLSGPCYFAAPKSDRSAFLRNCFPKRLEEQKHKLAQKLSAALMLRREPGLAGEVFIQQRFIAKDSAAASLVYNTVNDFWGEMIAVVNGRADELKAIVDEQMDSDPYARVVFDGWLEAIRNARIAREGLTIEVRAHHELTEDSSDALRTIARSSSPKREALEKVLGTLLKGQTPTADMLTAFMPRSAATRLLLPRAEAGDCKAVQEKLDRIAAEPNFPFEHKKRHDKLKQRWAADRCTGVTLAPSLKTCLDDARTLDALDQCPFPASPYLGEAAERLRGKWRAVHVAGRVNRYLLKMAANGVSETSLEISDKKADFVLDGVAAAGALDVVDATDTTATAMLPVKKRKVRTCLKRVGWSQRRIPGCKVRRSMKEGPHKFIITFLGDDLLQLRKHDEKLVTTYKRQDS